MSSPQITLAQTDADLQGILDLQARNQVRLLSPETQAAQGFVTIVYTLDEMRLMHQHGPSVIAKDGDRVVGYAITSAPAVRAHIPALESMFAQIDALDYDGKPLSQYAYYVMGQTCVDEAYRGQGVLDAMYAHHRATYENQYQMLVTDISSRNTRSQRAHERVGFRPLARFHEPGAGEEWIIVVWDWRA